MGNCDWLLLFHLWGGAAKFDRSSSSPAGHRQGRYRACPPGQPLSLFTPSSSQWFYKRALLKLVVLICFCVVSTDLWPWEGQRRAHMVSPADSLYLRKRHPHCFAGCGGSHPLHVSSETNSFTAIFQEPAVGDFRAASPLLFHKRFKGQILWAQDLAHHTKGQAAFLLWYKYQWMWQILRQRFPQTAAAMKPLCCV